MKITMYLTLWKTKKMIEFKEDSYIVGMWYADDPETENNWMCCVQRSHTNPKCFHGDYRFRYNKDGKIWDSKDEKSWWSFETKEDDTEESVIDAVNKLQSAIALKFPLVDYLEIKGDVSKFLELSKTKSWLHMKCEPMEKHKDKK